jgi:hypothetical protein
MKLNSFLASVVLYLPALTGGLYAQGVGTSGEIKGTITDPSGAVMPKVFVSIVETSKSIRRTAVTDAAGQYRITGLLPATYEVSAEFSGFSTQVQKNVVLNLGQTGIVDFHMRVSLVKQIVEVMSDPPVVDTERGSQADTVEEHSVREWPIDRRDYLTFTLLMPGVADSRTMADNTDFRVKQTPQSGLSFYGSNGRGNSVTVDGGEANDNAGGVRLTLSQDAVQEFQINRSNYSAELGSASGASINIVSKSGSNHMHGSAYAFFRNDTLDARPPFAFGPALKPGDQFSFTAKARPIKPPLNRQQFGGAVGFPIRKDRSFVYASYEGLRRDESASVPLLTDTSIFAPLPGQTAILNGLAAQGSASVPCISNPPTSLPADQCAALLQNFLTVDPASGRLDPVVVNQFLQNSGVFPFTATSDLLSVRLDHQFNEGNRVYLRYSFGRDNEHDPNIQALTAFSRGNKVKMWDSTLQGAWYHLFGARSQNEARVQWNYYKFDVVPNDAGGPGLDVTGYGFFNRDIFLPSFTTARRYEFADNFSTSRSHHTMKIGGSLLLHGDRAESHTFMSGRFGFGVLPGLVLSPCLGDPSANCGLAGLSSEPVTSLQSFKLGLPQFYQQGFGSPTVVSQKPMVAAYWQDSWAARPNLALNFGLRYELDSQYAPLNTDKDNFAPRISFAWDPFSDHKTVIRGGYGIFYSPIYYQIDYVVRALGELNGFRQIAQVFVPLTGAPGNPSLNSAVIYQTLFAQGRIGCGTPAGEACITPSDLTQPPLNIAITHTGPVPPLSVLFGGSPDYQSVYSQQAEFGIERKLGAEFSVSLSYIYAHTLGLPRAHDTNLLPAPLVPAGPSGTPIRQWRASQCQPPPVGSPLSCFVNPLLLQNNIYESAAGAVYNGGIFEVQKRFNRHFSILANYTYSKAEDDVTDYNSDFAANDQTNLRAERALSAFDQRHKLVVAGIFETPWKGGADSNLGERIFSGVTVSPILRGNSSRPFNLLVGADINGDRHPTTDRPPGAGRNTGIGPDFWTLDLRVSRQFSWGEGRNVQLTFESFDLLNRTNYSSVNNTVGVIGAPFNLHATNALSPSRPLAYTAALPRREIQLGVRLSF